MPDKPNCYTCAHRRNVPGDAHSACNNPQANVTAEPHGVRNGWFFWPANFDPTWLKTCDGHSTDPADKSKPDAIDPLQHLLGLVGKRFI